MEAIARAIAGVEAPSFETAEEFWNWHVEDARTFDMPVDRAIAGGASTDRLGYAFAAGYVAALHSLVPDLGRSGIRASLAATEEGGAHPKAITTSLTRRDDHWRLSGRKRWVTLGGSELLVLTQRGKDEGGRAQFALVRVGSDRPGVRLEAQPPPPFVPELSHASLSLEEVEVRDPDILPGDGWQNWVKPFRTVEDIHVHAALLGFLLSLAARSDWPLPLREKLASVLIAFRGLAAAPSSSPATHIALGGALEQVRNLVDESGPFWSRVDEETRRRWERDRPLLEVAGKARAIRLQRAWERLGAPSTVTS